MHLAATFFPALAVFMISFSVGIQNENLVSSFLNFYPLMVAMVFGSMIAGSTPLGGGVVAFPVTVLICEFSPQQGRDFSLLIQSIGMTSATYLILTERAHLLSGVKDLILAFCFFSFIGMVAGIHLEIDPFVVNIFYTTAVACFAILLAGFESVGAVRNTKEHENMKMLPNEAFNEDKICRISQTQDDKPVSNFSSRGTLFPIPISESSGDSMDLHNRVDSSSNCSKPYFSTMVMEDSPFQESLESRTDLEQKINSILLNRYEWIILVLSAILGGLIASQIGSGADIMSFAYCSFIKYVHANRRNKSRNNTIEITFASGLQENTFTAISIIVMTCTRIFGSILRIATLRVDPKVYEALLACSFIVVLGAPIGSMFLTPTHQRKLKLLFYLFSFLQVLIFGIIKIRSNVFAWMSMAIAIGLSCLSVFCFRKRSPLS